MFHCESCVALLNYCGMEDEGHFGALVRMFEQTLKAIVALELQQQDAFIERLDRICNASSKWGWGVDKAMEDLMTDYGFGEE